MRTGYLYLRGIGFCLCPFSLGEKVGMRAITLCRRRFERERKKAAQRRNAQRIADPRPRTQFHRLALRARTMSRPRLAEENILNLLLGADRLGEIGLGRSGRLTEIQVIF